MVHPVFTPTAVPPERLDEVTVGRVDLIARLVTRLRDVATTGVRPHTLLVGPRGSGKTHLLSVVLHRARLDPVVDAGLAVAWVPEDALSIGSYEDLLVELVRVLEHSREAEARDLRRDLSASGLERLLLEVAGERVLVLVLENLDRIFTAIAPGGQAALRGLVETSASVVLLASAPLLFSAVSSRDQPWYGSFDAEHLGDLGLAEGTELLVRAASEADDNRLAAFVTSPSGQARLRAVEHLAGGSPRLWHILSGCITFETLDELVPAVEAVLDELAPYYQQRLWELPATEQKLVVQLGREQGSRTVSHLAEAVGASNRVAATALGRLADSRWVRGVKVPGTDQRTTWYELREPLLRHHLQYRDARGEPLRFVVEFLSVWYADEERRQFLAGASPGSAAERHLVRTLLEGPAPRFDSAWAARDPDRLLAEARCWMDGSVPTDRLSGSPALGAAIEAVILTARGSDVKQLPARKAGMERRALADALRVAEEEPGGPAERVGAGLRALAAYQWPPDDTDLVALIATCWDGSTDPAAAREALGALRARRLDDYSLLSLAVRDEYAFWTAEAGEVAAARDLFSSVVADRTRAHGPEHPDTLTSRQSFARWTGWAGDPAAARDLSASLVADRARVLGADHPDTLTSRFDQAFWTGEAGDLAAARDLFASVAADQAGVLGADHPDTLTSRQSHARWTARAGDPATARDLFASLVADRARVLGTDHPDTMSSRDDHAFATGEAGDATGARDLFASVSAERTRVLGADHPDTLFSGHYHAFWTGQAGVAAAARDLFASVVAERARVLGADHPDTLSSRDMHAFWTGKAGDAAAARELFAAVATDRGRVLGRDHPATRNSHRGWVRWTLLSQDVTDFETMQRLFDEYPQDNFSLLVLNTVLAAHSRPRGWRSAVLKAAQGRFATAPTVGLERLRQAFDGAPAALAELPAEFRPIVQTLNELDARGDDSGQAG